MYNKEKLQFANIADINTDHYLVFPEVDTIIKDILQRDTIIRNRIQTRPEGTETFRWVEQTAMATNAAFGDPRSIGTTVSTTPTRVEKLAKLKSIQNRITYGLFDEELTKNGSFAYILEKDMKDAIGDMLKLSNNAIWTGTDTSYGTPTTAQYMGLLTAKIPPLFMKKYVHDFMHGNKSVLHSSFMGTYGKPIILIIISTTKAYAQISV